MTNHNGRNHLIDGLRFLAATSVMLFHFNLPALDGENWYQTVCAKLWLGVPVFFVISGYCIFIAIEHSKTARQFIVRRFFRIFPAYWLSLVFMVLAIGLSIMVEGQNSVVVIPKTVSGIVAVLTLLTDPFSNTPTVNSVSWSLTYELFFYIVTALVLLLNRKYWLSVLIGITLIAVLVPEPGHGFLFWLQCWPIFSFGVALYYLIHNREALLWGGVLLTISLIGIVIKNPYPPFYVMCIVTGVLIALNSFKPVGNNFLSSLGDYSYAMYLLHTPVGAHFLLYFKTPAIQANIVLTMLYDLAALVLIVLLSAVVYKYVEKPFMGYGKRMTAKMSVNVAN